MPLFQMSSMNDGHSVWCKLAHDFRKEVQHLKHAQVLEATNKDQHFLEHKVTNDEVSEIFVLHKITNFTAFHLYKLTITL